MLQHTLPVDLSAERLRAVTARLEQCLGEAGIVRVRLLTARDANVWPALHNLPSPPCSTSSPYKN
jgi:hypothetical protein